MSLPNQFRKIALSLGLGLAVIGGASAAIGQETTAVPVAPEAAPATDLAMGTAAPVEEGGIGSNYTAASFELWEQRCVRTEDGSDPCELYQLLKDADGNAVAEISMFGLPDGGEAAAGATIVAPLETLLTANITLGIDGGDLKAYPFTFCAKIGCIARVGFTPAEVEQFKKGSKAILTIVPAVAPDQKVVLNISLAGFTAGFAAVKATMPVGPKPAE